MVQSHKNLPASAVLWTPTIFTSSQLKVASNHLLAPSSASFTSGWRRGWSKPSQAMRLQIVIQWGGKHIKKLPIRVWNGIRFSNHPCTLITKPETMDFHMHFDDFLWNSLKQIHHPGVTEVTTPIIMVWVWESRLPPSWVSNLAPVGAGSTNTSMKLDRNLHRIHVHICRMSCFQMFVNFLQESYRSFIQNLNGMNPNSISLIGIGVCQSQSWEAKFHRFQVVRGCENVCVCVAYI